MSGLFRITRDESVQQNWGNLFNILQQPQNARSDNKGAIDQILIRLVTDWLERRDQCGVVQDLLDIALFNIAGNTLDELAGEDLSGYLPPGYNLTDTTSENDGGRALTASELSGTYTKDHRDDGDRRYLQFFADNQCSTFESTIFLGSMLSFSSCAEVDIGKFFGTVEENVVNTGLRCLNTFLQPFQRSETCASRNFQNYVMDECVKGIVHDDILGHIFQLFLVSPKQTCGCMSTLAAVPQCRVDVTSSVSLDGLLTSKMACLLESQVCNRLEDECDNRLGVLDECLPNLFDINNDNFDCEEVMCRCEQDDKGLLNYPGKAMELPMSDMCVDHAVANFMGSFIPERYAVLQAKCGAKFLHQPADPTMAPSLAPSQRPSGDDGLSALIQQREESNSSVNSVISGILLALAITGVASIFLVFVLVLWRRRFRSGGKKIQTIAEMKAHAQEQIHKLENELRRMEEQQQDSDTEESIGRNLAEL